MLGYIRLCNVVFPVNGMGNEHNAVLKYVQRFNFTLNIYDNMTEENFGNIYLNGTADGIIAGLLNEDDSYCDLIYGGTPRDDYMDVIRSVIYTYEVSVPLPK